MNMASKKTAKKVVSKDDLRRLMKEQKTIRSKDSSKIDSPLAKYNSFGELSCVVCKCPVKSDLQWGAHVMGRLHKENVERMKISVIKSAHPLPPSQEPLNNQNKRKATDDNNDSHLFKVPKSVASTSISSSRSQLPVDFFDQSSSLTTMPRPTVDRTSDSDTSSDDSDCDVKMDEDLAQSTSIVLPSSAVGQLPADFFDVKVPVIVEEESDQTVIAKLPEGFFDDPKMDAKARQVVYRDKMDVEYEVFEKQMKEETMVSDALLEEDDEMRDAARSIDQIDDSIHRWKNVHRLELQRAKIQSLPQEEEAKAKSDDSDLSDIDINEFDEFPDWRSKQVWK